MKEIITEILNSPEGIVTLMGSTIDAYKFRSCMTLFYYATRDKIFKDAIEKKCWNSWCDKTKEILKKL